MATGAEILRVAAREIGTYEDPSGSNNVKYNTWYYGHPVQGKEYAWCMVFVQWCYEQAGSSLPFRTARCSSLFQWYREHQPDCIRDEPEKGCIVIFDFPNTGSTTDHTGLFDLLDGNYIVTIEGNTDEEHGGGVKMRRRKVSDFATKPIYIVPRELHENKHFERYDTMSEIEDAAPWAVSTIKKLISIGALTGTSGWYDSEGYPTGLDLSEDMLRVFVIMDRAGSIPSE